MSPIGEKQHERVWEDKMWEALKDGRGKTEIILIKIF